MTQFPGWQPSLSGPLDETVMVSLDLETTGLDGRSDKIIEIGNDSKDHHQLDNAKTLLFHGPLLILKSL